MFQDGTLGRLILLEHLKHLLGKLKPRLHIGDPKQLIPINFPRDQAAARVVGYRKNSVGMRMVNIPKRKKSVKQRFNGRSGCTWVHERSRDKLDHLLIAHLLPLK